MGDIDDLIVDRQHGEQDIGLAAQEVTTYDENDITHGKDSIVPTRVVVWPPSESSELETSVENNYSQRKDQKTFIEEMTLNGSENVVKKKKNKKFTKKAKNSVEVMNMKNNKITASHQYNRNSLMELDAQILEIQRKFEADLDGLLDIYNQPVDHLP